MIRDLIVYVNVLLMTLIFMTQSDAEIDPKNIVGIWLFDEGKGEKATDSSSNGNHAVFTGKPKWVGGKFGSGLDFNGKTDYLAAPDSKSLNIINSITIVAWIKGNAYPAANHVLRKIADAGTAAIYMLRIQPETLRIYIGTVDKQVNMAGNTILKPGKWYHVAMTYDGKKIIAYLDGKVDGSLDANGKIVESRGELRIGRGEPAGYFNGVIDEVGLFNKALTEGEIKSIMIDGFESILAVELGNKLTNTWANIKLR